ncbi:hypothetical protein LEL_10714 [Akanthomyces lecanii RCEF 1005]|uniref:Uncharacterized protein n=1 Tax=Akanthomyces lecanii RCEF 1005 TaxID=1081108 RepID=A0A167V9N3_CORDF|nr:hypothetical protein LEL_10714 [Akanthomyces lecanii RCEF 1005]
MGNFISTTREWTNWAKSPFFIGPLGGLLGPLSNTLGQDCKGECPAGQIPIASDGFNCQPGTYSYFCCDNPNSPSIPTAAEAICPRPPNFPGVNSESDPESNSDTKGVLESTLGEDDCSLSFLNSGHSKRDNSGNATTVNVL